ncbi:MAG TPA: carboxypeptidase-like regulatory domain-containing protein [Candidatus Thermoplasmatota archaeon]
MRSVSVAFLFLMAVFAGCLSGGGTTPNSTEGPGPVAYGEPIPDAATIQGLVVDDSQAPIEGALVAIVGIGLQATTDSGGSFQFVNVPPGPHDISAIKLGYSSSGKRVEVAANQRLEGVFLTLIPIVVEQPYQETFGPFSGYFECHIGGVNVMSCAGDTIHRREEPDQLLFPNNKRFMQYTLSSDNWETMWGEARWNPAAVATAPGMAIYPSYMGRWAEDNRGHWWCEADGPSPTWFRFDQDESRSICNSTGGADEPKATMAANPLVVVADPGFADIEGGDFPVRVMYQQRFEVIMTIFYGEPAPADFTAFPDA